MARVYTSSVINARSDRVWARIRDFNGLPNWHPAIAESRIENGEPADKIGCVRDFRLRNGDRIREKLLGLSDHDLFCTYSILESPMGVVNYVATLRLTPVTDGERTFAEWTAEFDCAPERETELVTNIGTGVFQGGFDALKRRSEDAVRVLREGDPDLERLGPLRDAGRRSCKSTIIDAPVDRVWSVLRDFNGHDRWHPAVATSAIERGAPSDKVGCVRRFRLKDGAELREQLLTLSDLEQTFSYCLLDTPVPLFNYVAHVRLMPVTDGDRTFWGWESRFTTRAGEEAAMTEMVGEQIYQAGFDAIRRHLAA